MTYRFTISDKGSDAKYSNSRENALKYAKDLAKARPSNVITIKCNKGHFSESFTWCSNSNDIVPAY